MKHEQFLSLPKSVQNFLSYSENIKGKSSTSINEYFFDLQTFFRYILLLKGFVPPETEFDKIDISKINDEFFKCITLSDLYSFLVYCKNERGNNSSTRARKVSTLKIFFKYLTFNERILDVNPAELLETPKTRNSLPKHLTLEDSINLLNSVNGKYAERDYCILTLFLNCGLRLSELVNLNLTDISSEYTLKVLGKGNKERIVYLNQACIDAINSYLAVRPKENIPPKYQNALFISRNHSRISNKTVQYIVKKYLDMSGLGNMGYSTHKLRHTAATLMYQQGNVDVRVLKEVLGHSNLGTTQIYTHVANNQIKQAINANPLANISKLQNGDNNEKN